MCCLHGWIKHLSYLGFYLFQEAYVGRWNALEPEKQLSCIVTAFMHGYLSTDTK